jgi:hypothetical protein
LWSAGTARVLARFNSERQALAMVGTTAAQIFDAARRRFCTS